MRPKKLNGQHLHLHLKCPQVCHSRTLTVDSLLLLVEYSTNDSESAYDVRISRRQGRRRRKKKKRGCYGIDHLDDPLRSNTLIQAAGRSGRRRQRVFRAPNSRRSQPALDILGFIWLANEFLWDFLLLLPAPSAATSLRQPPPASLHLLNNIERFVSVAMVTFHTRTARCCLVVARSLV